VPPLRCEPMALPRCLGILMLDTRFPRLPGDVGPPASWSMPVRLRRGAGRLAAARGAAGRPGAAGSPSSTPHAPGGRRGCGHHHQLRLPGALAGRTAGRPAGAGVDLGAAGAAGPAPRRVCSRSMPTSLRAAHLLAAGADCQHAGGRPGARLRCSAPCCRTCPTLDAAAAEADTVAAALRLVQHPAQRRDHWCWNAPTCRPMPPPCSVPPAAPSTT
jgi:hypothetical protein